MSINYSKCLIKNIILNDIKHINIIRFIRSKIVPKSDISRAIYLNIWIYFRKRYFLFIFWLFKISKTRNYNLVTDNLTSIVYVVSGTFWNNTFSYNKHVCARIKSISYCFFKFHQTTVKETPSFDRFRGFLRGRNWPFIKNNEHCKDNRINRIMQTNLEK